MRDALAEHGWAFADDDPAVGAVKGGRVSLTEGLRPERNQNATGPTQVDPAEWIESLPKPRQREQGRAMLELFGEVTGVPAVMWGPSIVGYGELHYVYESGREGDMPRVGFSPRSTALTLYVLDGSPAEADLLGRLGTYTRGASCLYIKNLDDVDLSVLAEMVEHAWNNGPSLGGC